MSLEMEAQRGQLAKSVLDNPVYQDAYKKIEEALTRTWRESRDRDEREELHRLLKSLDKVQALVLGVMKSGEIAEAKLRQRASLRQRVGRIVSGG